jgi:hypothetical protein
MNLLIGAHLDAGGSGAFYQLATSEFGPNPAGSKRFHLDPGVKGTPEP